MSDLIKKQALDHYDRMIAWAEKQNMNEECDSEKMEDSIGEEWHGIDCVYCKIDIEKRKKNNDFFPCSECELGNGKKSNHSKNCCNGLWFKMASSHKWKTWLKYAKKVREYIEQNG